MNRLVMTYPGTYLRKVVSKLWTVFSSVMILISSSEYTYLIFFHVTKVCWTTLAMIIHLGYRLQIPLQIAFEVPKRVYIWPENSPVWSQSWISAIQINSNFLPIDYHSHQVSIFNHFKFPELGSWFLIGKVQHLDYERYLRKRL